MLYVLYSIHAEKGNEILMIGDSGFNGFNGFRWRLRRDPSTQVAAVLAFVISHTTFLTAQDDETGAMPEGLRITGFPFRVSKHRPPDRK